MEEILLWLEERAAARLRESRSLTADDRGDEGDLAKIGANVYGICKSIIQAVGIDRTGERLAGLHTIWSEKLEQALAHEDARQVAVEKIKLDALAEVQRRLEGN